MGLYDNWPYTNFHELNLDWVMQEVKKAVNEVNELYNQLQEMYKKLPQMEGEIYRLETKLNNEVARINAYLSQLTLRLDNLDFATREEVAEQIARVYAALELSVFTLKTDIKLLYSYVDTRHRQQKDYIDREIAYLENEVYDITLNPVQEVISPVTNLKVSLQQGLNDVYNELYNILSNVWGLTVWEYDTLYLSVKEYDDYNLTVAQYDYVGKWYLWKTKCCYDTSMGLTVNEYDDMGITVGKYDNQNLTVQGYDQLARWYFNCINYA